MRLAAGSRLAQYEVFGPLGSGGMGEVYRAVDRTLHRTVALKLLTAAADMEVRAALDAVHSGLYQRPAAATPAGRRRVAAAAVALLVFAALVAWQLGRLRSDAPAAVRSIAVLPFTSVSREAAEEEFAEGMTAELITSLAKIHGLQVKSRSASMKYRGSTLSAGEIARALGVDAVVEASILHSGDRVRITAGLVEAGSDRQVWSQRYEQALSDVLALQSEVARAVASELQVRLTPHDHSRLTVARRVDADAYQLYVRGMTRFARHNNADNLAAIEMFEQAIARDPDFAAAHGGLAIAYALRAFSYDARNREAMEQKSRAAVDRALALDPNLANAHLARSRLLWSPERGWPHIDAIRQMRHAAALDPASEHAARHLGIVYTHVGFPDQALEQFAKADVVHPAALVQIAMAHHVQGRLDEALSAWNAIPPHARTPFALLLTASVLVEAGRVGEADAALEEYARDRTIDDYSGHFAAARALVAAATGRTREAEAEIDKALARRQSGEFHHASYAVAAAYLRMNRPAEAMRWLEHAASDGFPCYPLFARDPALDPLRRDPAFIAFLERQRASWERHRVVVAGE